MMFLAVQISPAGLLLILISPLLVSAESHCPEGSWGELQKDADYVDKGIVELIGSDLLPIYRVGNAENCIIWNYDIHGFNAGRTRQLCDQLAEKGYTVLLPDYFRGNLLDISDKQSPKVAEYLRNETNWSVLRATWVDTIKPYAEQLGCEAFGAIGTCWGTYLSFRYSSLSEFKAGVSMHPSQTLIMKMLEEDETEAMEDIKGKPQLLMPAGDDDPNSKHGGLAEKVLGDTVKIVEFNDMKHGWTTRGDISDPKVEEEVKRAMVEATQFFNEHLKLESNSSTALRSYNYMYYIFALLVMTYCTDVLH